MPKCINDPKSYKGTEPSLKEEDLQQEKRL